MSIVIALIDLSIPSLYGRVPFSSVHIEAMTPLRARLSIALVR